MPSIIKKKLYEINNTNTVSKKLKQFSCSECDYTATRKYILKRHEASIHKINFKWTNCNLCSHKCIRPDSIKIHKAVKHNINTTWYFCNIHTNGFCDYKTNIKGNLKIHKSFKHNIEVTWFYCNIANCDHRAKSLRNLTMHIKNIHIFLYKCPECAKKFKTECKLKHHLHSHVFDYINIGLDNDLNKRLNDCLNDVSSYAEILLNEF